MWKEFMNPVVVKNQLWFGFLVPVGGAAVNASMDWLFDGEYIKAFISAVVFVFIVCLSTRPENDQQN